MNYQLLIINYLLPSHSKITDGKSTKSLLYGGSMIGNFPAEKEYYQLSIINYQLLIINYQLSIINYQLLIINYL